MSGSPKQEHPGPGELLVYDYRPAQSKGGDAHARPQRRAEGREGLRFVQWNIERGYKMPEIINILQAHKADVICLQELDIGCERSEYRNVAQEIAEALRMKLAFVTEFVELHSPLRGKDLQGGGVHGNAILSRFDFEPYVFPHSHHPVVWEAEGAARNEPRRGERVVLAADVHIPGVPSPVVFYSLHLEVFCGIFDRLKQFADVLEDSRLRFDRDGRVYQVVMGDFNTLAHGIARFSPNYCRDIMRFVSLGWTESEWWQKHVFDAHSEEQGGGGVENEMLGKYRRFMSARDLQVLRNNYFLDPFCPASDNTLSNYRGWYTGKLDWLLLRGFLVKSKGLDNLDYAASDHRLMFVNVDHVTVTPDADLGANSSALPRKDPGPAAYKSNISALGNSRNNASRGGGVLGSALLSLAVPVALYFISGYITRK